MAPEPPVQDQGSGALRPFPPGPLLTIAQGTTRVAIAPEAGGRVAGIAHDGVEWLVGHGEATAAMIAWGSFPMLPWVGRVRRGRFAFRGQEFRLPPNLGAHAIHGVGFALPWRVDAAAPDQATLSLALPEDERWPFGGTARQHIAIDGQGIRMQLEVGAGAKAMPAALGWHPWFRKPERIDFAPRAMYVRDAEGIALPSTVAPAPGPWDDCFVNDAPVVLHLGGQRLQLESDCDHWVVYDETAHATCVEPQSGPPDGFNLQPQVLEPGGTLHRWFRLRWL